MAASEDGSTLATLVEKLSTRATAADCPSLLKESTWFEVEATLCARLLSDVSVCGRAAECWVTRKAGRRTSWDSFSSEMCGHGLEDEASKMRFGCSSKQPRQMQ